MARHGAISPEARLLGIQLAAGDARARRRVEAVLRRRSVTAAAEELGVHRVTLQRWISAHGLKSSDKL